MTNMNDEKLIPTICYKVAEPVVYNKGTKHKSSCDEFLACYHYNKEEAKQECEKLNSDAEYRNEWERKHGISHEAKTYFVGEQPMMY